MKSFKSTVFVMAVFLSGCATAPISKFVDLRSAYDSGEFALSGSTDLHVNAFLRTRGGDIKLCAGYEVTLWKQTIYSAERVSHLYDRIGDVLVGNPNTASLQFSSGPPFQMTKICDSSGKVLFSGVPPGKYYVSSLVMWDVYDSNIRGLTGSGGLTAKIITVTEDDDRIDLVLTR